MLLLLLRLLLRLLPLLLLLLSNTPGSINSVRASRVVSRAAQLLHGRDSRGTPGQA
jgi:hypothetical protein